MIQDERVDTYLAQRSDAVHIHARKLPALPCQNAPRRKLKKAVKLRLSTSFEVDVTGHLGSGAFAHVFSATVGRGSGQASSVALKVCSFVSATLVWCLLSMLARGRMLSKWLTQLERAVRETSKQSAVGVLRDQPGQDSPRVRHRLDCAYRELPPTRRLPGMRMFLVSCCKCMLFGTDARLGRTGRCSSWKRARTARSTTC